jgi:hypothetical protein
MSCGWRKLRKRLDGKIETLFEGHQEVIGKYVVALHSLLKDLREYATKEF